MAMIIGSKWVKFKFVENGWPYVGGSEKGWVWKTSWPCNELQEKRRKKIFWAPMNAVVTTVVLTFIRHRTQQCAHLECKRFINPMLTLNPFPIHSRPSYVIHNVWVTIQDALNHFSPSLPHYQVYLNFIILLSKVPHFWIFFFWKIKYLMIIQLSEFFKINCKWNVLLC